MPFIEKGKSEYERVEGKVEPTVETLLDNWSKHLLRIRAETTLAELARKRNISATTFEDWTVIERIEALAGSGLGKIREKISSIEEMLSHCQDRSSF